MSCPPGPPTFRLLDAFVGWDERTVQHLTGLADPAGLELAYADGRPAGAQRDDLLPWFTDPRLAQACGPCGWYLLSANRGLLRRDPCDGTWDPVWSPECDPALSEPALIAARGHLFAVAEPDRVRLWRNDGDHLAATIPLPAAAVALTSWDEVLVAPLGSTDLHRFDRAGVPCGRIRTGVTGRIEGLATGRDCTIWLLTTSADAEVVIWRGERDHDEFHAATLDDLSAAVQRTALIATSDRAFCLEETGADGGIATTCVTWDGYPADAAGSAPAPRPRARGGLLVTHPIDSGLPRCRWHRVRVEAGLPDGTSVTVAVATAEDPARAPHPDDWQEGRRGSVDFLIDQPPGRYLHVRLRLVGDGVATPVVRRVRLDFPRVTSAEHLPAVYRQDPAAEDFTERFLALFDAGLEQLDRAVERHSALLDPGGVPDEALPWLASLLGLAFDADWDAATRRALLTAAPELYRRRGTPWALRTAIKIVFKVEPVIAELGADRNWAALGLNTLGRLGATRLFGRSSARLRLGTSALSGAPLRSFGDPDSDPLTAHAHRVRVLLPPARGWREPDRRALTRLVERQAPAHTVAELRLGGLGFVVGTWSAVGVDTAFTPLPAPVLGGNGTARSRGVRLGRASVVWPKRGRRPALRLGVTSTVDGMVAE